MLTKTARRITLAIALVATMAPLTVSYAQSAVGGTDPQPIGQAVGGTDPQPIGQAVGGTDPQPIGQAAGGSGYGSAVGGVILAVLMMFGMA